MGSTECDYDVLGSYLPSFLDHLEETRARLGVSLKDAVGVEAAGSQPRSREESTTHTLVQHDSDNAHSRSPSPLADAAQSPSPWTEAEHAALFRALSVYSRWRPDLVAACVPTRSAWEVSVYLEALEEEAARLAALENGSTSGGMRRGQSVGRMKNKGKGKAVELDMNASSGPSSSSSDSPSDSSSDSNSDRDSSSYTPRHPYAPHEPAHELSSDWIDVEESMAAWVVREDWLVQSMGGTGQTFDADSDAEEDIQDVKPQKRRRGRPRQSRKRQRRGAGVSQKRAASRSSSHSQPLSLSHPAETPDLPSKDVAREEDACPARKRRRCQLTRESALARLEEAHLVVLDGMLRDAEEAEWMRHTDGSQVPVREPSVIAPECGRGRERAAPGEGCNTRPHVVGIDRDPGELTTDTRTMNAGAAVVSDSMIDPVLLAMSQVPRENTSSSTPASGLPPILMPQASVLTAGPLPQPPIPTVVDATPRDAPDASHLSPRSRRRLHKRLYMRRRRALLRAGSLGSSGAAESAEIGRGGNVDRGQTKDEIWKQSLGLERLKPGKKAKLGQSTTPASSVAPSAPASEPASDTESEPESRAVRKQGDTGNLQTRSNKPGLTLPYKLKATFAELGIDAAYLRAEGMDLLHLGALGKLMGLYTSLNHGDDEDDGQEETSPAQSIDVQLIRHLQAAVVWFVTDVVHRSIVWKEREVMLKKRSLAWRGSDQLIGPSAVEHALTAVGARYQNHKEYFSSLLVSYEVAEAKTKSPSGDEGDAEAAHASEADFGADAEDSSPAPPALSCHRDIYTPIIRPPSAWAIPPIDCFSRTYTQEATRTRRGKSKEIYEDQLMPDETDEEALEAELREDDGVDRQDMETAKDLEERLWKAVRRDQGASDDD